MSFKLLPLAKYFGCFLILLPLHVLSQDLKKIPGFYVSQTGDTTKGYFNNYKEWSKNPSTVTFISTESNNILTLTPANTRSFSVDNFDTYISYSGTRLTNPTELFNTSSMNDANDQLDTVNCFLRTVFSSDTFKLFMLSDEVRNNFFYQTKTKPITELIYKTYFADNGSLVQSATFKNQLNNLFYGQINKKQIEIDKLQYDEKSFYDFLTSIFNTPKTGNKNAAKLKTRFFVTGGVAFNSFSVTGDNAVAEVSAKYSGSIAPAMALGCLIPSHRNFGRLSASPQIRISSFNNTGAYRYNDWINHDSSSFTYKASLKINFLAYVGYNIIQTKNISWRLAAGGGIMLLLNNKETAVNYRNSGTPSSTETKQRSLTGSINLQTSVLLSKGLLVILDYNLPAAITNNYVFYSGNHSTLQLTAGIAF